MKYNKIQKIISIFLLFIFFFGQITGLSFLGLLKTKEVLAKNSSYHDLVSIIVDEKTYDELDSEIERYAEDIQHYLNNTKVVILPIKENTTAFQIASINENLFFEGYKGLKKDVDFESKLIGTILIGNFPVPIISENGKVIKSIVPYVDFEDKKYIFDPKTKLFEESLDNLDGLKPEIWQGIISPNSGDFDKNIEQIKNFLDKDHDFYKGENLFDVKKEILNGNNKDGINKNYKPYVFYFDQFREQKSLNYMLYKGYDAYLQNKEDLAYYRYGQELNKNVQKIVKEGKDLEIKKALEGIKDPKIIKAFKNEEGLDTKNVPDILLSKVINSSTKQFLEIFNKGTISDFRKNVHNAGRYNTSNSKVNVDIIPYMISILDEATDKTLKSINNDLEAYIFAKLKPEIIHVPIPVSIRAVEGLPKNIGPGNDSSGIDFTDSEKYSEDDIKIRGDGSRIPAEFFMQSNSITPDQIHFSDRCVLIEGIESKGSNFFACSGGAKEFAGKTGLLMKRSVFAQILDMTGFYADSHGNTEFQLQTGENVKMKVPALRKILENYSSKYDNFYHGRSSEYFGGPEGGSPGEPIYCSIYRGSGTNSGQLVEANQGFNSRNGEDNAELIKNCIKKDIPFEHNEPFYSAGHWGGNSILNYDTNDGNKVVLKDRYKTLSIEDLYDPVGAQIVEGGGEHPGIHACYRYNYILTKKPINTSDPAKQAQKMGYAGLRGIENFFKNPYNIPLELTMNNPLKRIEPKGWTCHTENQKFNPDVQTAYGKIYTYSSLLRILCDANSAPFAKNCGGMEDIYNGNDGVNSAEDCLVNGIELWYIPMGGGNRKIGNISTYFDHEGNEVLCPVTRYRYDFTSTEGYIKHHEPTIDTLNKHLKTKSIPNLPIDRDRYLEIFTGDILKFKYPYLFRLTIDPDKDFNVEKTYFDIKSGIESLNNRKSKEINSLSKLVIIKKIKKILEDINLNQIDKIAKIRDILKKYIIKDTSGIIYKIKNILDGEKDIEIKIKEIDNILKSKNNKDILEFDLKNVYTIEGARKALERYLEDYDNKTDNIFEIKKYVTTKEDQKLKIGGEEKTYNYFDILAFAVLWNNLPNVSAKYKFILQNYLSDQVGGNKEKYLLPKNKKQYEIAYLGAPGDAKNMYVKMDPEEKGINPFASTMAKSSKLSSNILSLGVINNVENLDKKQNSNFKCAPPEGVPIWEWIPAIICRLKSLLPPKIGIEWVCGNELFDGEDEYDDETNYGGGSGGGGTGGGGGISNKDKYKQEQKKCKNDNNNNGINDCLENKINKLELRGDKKVVSFDTNGNLLALVEDKAGNRILLDNSSDITFELQKIIDKKTNKVVFDVKKDNFYDKKNIINDYIFFNPIKLKARYGKAKATYTVREKEADVIFKAKLKLNAKTYYTNRLFLKKNGYNYKVRNLGKQTVTKNLNSINLTSNDLHIKIRKNLLFLDARFVDGSGSLSPDYGTIKVNDNTNIYLFTGNKDFKDFDNLNKNSLILKLNSFDKYGKKRNINFPIKVKIKNKKGQVVFFEKIKSLNNLKELVSIDKSGEYKLEVFDNYGFNTLFNFEALPGNLDNLKLNLGTNLLDYKNGISSNLVSLYDRFGNIVSDNLFKYKFKIIGDSVLFENGKKEFEFNGIEGYKAFRLKSSGVEGNSKILVEIYKGKDKLKSTSKNIRTIKDINIEVKFNDKLKVGGNEYQATVIFKDKNGNKLKDLSSRVYLNAGEYLKSNEIYTNIIAGESKIKFKTLTKASQKAILNFRIEGFSQMFTKTTTVYPDKAFYISLIPTKTKFNASNTSSTKVYVYLKDIYNNTIFTDSSSKISIEIPESYNKLIKATKKEITLNKGVGFFKFFATETPGTVYIKFKINKDLEKNTFSIGIGKDKKELKGLSETAIKLETFFFWNKNDIVGRKYNALYTTLLGANYGDFTIKDYLASGMLFDKNNRSLAVTSLIDNPYNFKDILTISNNGLLQKVNNAGDLSQDLNLTLIKDENNKYYIDLFNNALNIHIGKIYLNFDNLKITEDTYKLIEQNKFNFKDFGIKEFKSYNALNDSQLEIYLKTTKNSFIFNVNSIYYSLRQQNLGNNKRAIIITYKDPFESNTSLNSFARESLYSYENFKKNGSVGWKAGNKTLLEFASGVSAGEASKKYMGPLVVTLGDPVISLKKIKKKSYGIEKNFDSTIGKKLNDLEIKEYKIFDYNADNSRDIITIDANKFISLLENKKGNFLNQKYLARIADLGNVEFVLTGDYSGDNYDDIFFVDKKGNPNLLNNIKKDFKRVDLTKEFDLKARIIAVKSFDMDADGIDDIITLDESGKINIFYGQKDSLKFTKNTIYEGYGLKLDSEFRSDLSAIYFEGLNKTVNIKGYENLENLMFEKLTYDLNTNRDKKNYSKQTKFLKGQFAKAVGIEIKRTYKDENGGILLAKDKVKVNLTIKNISNKTIKNIVYAENIPKYFTLNYSSIKLSDSNIKLRKNLGNYKFYLDKFELKKDEEVKIEYELITKPLLYKKIDVGLFEKGEAGDDIYGDIIVKDSVYNCGFNVDIFRSISKRKYQKGIKEADCETDDNLPKEIKRNKIDKNNNGIPDYLDELTEGDPEKIQEYSEEKLNEMYEDEKLEEDPGILDSINGFFDKIENIFDGLNCGFGGSNCFGLPVNWAPLAPGNDPVAFGMLLGDGLKIDEGIPVLSGLTGKDVYGSWGCLQVPTVWPISPDKYKGICGQEPGAGGILGIDSPTNFFRIFVTPTLTGQFGVAACFGGPAEKVGNIPPKGLSPVIPGGNCVVYATKSKDLCEDSELKQKPESLGQVYFADCADGNGFGVINGNCEFSGHKKLPATNKIDTTLAKQFLDHRMGKGGSGLSGTYKGFLKQLSKNDVNNKKDLIKGASNIDIDLDINIGGKKFSDVEEITNTRIDAFPDFITGWIDRQLEEIITKLADFPTLYIIPPRFNNIIKGNWDSYANKLSSDSKSLAKTSGIKEAYDFIAHIPFVNVEVENVEVNIPSGIDLDTSIQQRKLQLKMYEQQIEELKNEAGTAIKPGNIIKIQDFQKSVLKNVAAIQSYIELPEKIANLAGKKQERLSQILCYIDAIQEMTGGRIYKNGLRFKAWVETYLLVKAALKSWQLLADIFIDYDLECHECKNERYDSIGFQFKLVSMIIPKIPIIEFPKWPDIVLDMHNIRLGINLKLPDFKLKERQIVLPPLPNIRLPSISECINFDINLPEIPTLEMLDIGTLPDLPPIPKLELPDLPPPPKLPKILGALEGILSIMKLVTRAMCILKKIPLVPETRAGDQIAFLTEGSGYRSFDFSFGGFQLPNFSFPWVDEIKVTTYVNLEQDVDFLTEIAKSIVEPINKASNNFFNMFNGIRTTIDFSGVCEDEEDNSTNGDGYSKNVKGGTEYPDSTDYKDDPDTSYNNFKLTPFNLAQGFSIGIQKVQKCIKKNSKDNLSAKEFLSFVNKQLASDFIVNDNKLEKLRHSFDTVNNYTYSKEDKLIKKLIKENNEKYETIKSIIKQELQETKKFKNNFKNIKNSKYEKISNNVIEKQKLYNKALEKYNNSFKKASQKLFNPSYFDTQSLKKDGEELKNRISNGLKSFEKQYIAYNDKKLLAINKNSKEFKEYGCYGKSSTYKRKYKGIYIIQKQNGKKISYRLFDYLDDLNGKEVTTSIDYDKDGDKDLLYLMDGNLYLKKNLRKEDDRNIYLSGVDVLDIDDNKFINGEIFYEAINNVYESFSTNNYLNISFNASNNDSSNNYRLSFYQIIDKYQNIENKDYIPENIKEYIVDAISGEGKINKIKENDNYIKYKNIAYIDDIGSNIGKILLKTTKLVNIKNSLKNGSVAIIQARKKIFAGKNDVVISYLENDEQQLKEIRIKAYTNIEFKNGIKVVKISGNAYVKTNKQIILKGTEIFDYIGLPLDFDAIIKIFDDNFSANLSSHITIKYYEGSEAKLDFRKMKYYSLYDLGPVYNNYAITLNIKNDYYYTKLQSFKNNIFGTKTNQVLVSPQLEADHSAPELDLSKKIKIPVYQEVNIDFTNSIYEDSGIENIKEFKIEGLDKSKFKIEKTNTKIAVLFGKFDDIFKKKIKIILVDKNDNRTEKQINFEVYSPIPKINTIKSSGQILGNINEKLNNEPINFYRIRGNLITKIINSSGSTRTYTNSGNYIFDSNLNKSDYLSVTSSGSEIFRVNEYTGKINILDLNYHIKASIAEDNFINIGVFKNNKEVFNEKIDLTKTNNEIKLTDNFNNLKDKGLYFKFNSLEYDYYVLPKTVAYNPGALVLYRKTDINKNPLFVILPNGQIKAINNFYKINYSSLGNYIIIKLIDKHYDKNIGSLLFKIKNAFILK